MMEEIGLPRKLNKHLTEPLHGCWAYSARLKLWKGTACPCWIVREKSVGQLGRSARVSSNAGSCTARAHGSGRWIGGCWTSPARPMGCSGFMLKKIFPSSRKREAGRCRLADDSFRWSRVITTL